MLHLESRLCSEHRNLLLCGVSGHDNLVHTAYLLVQNKVEDGACDLLFEYFKTHILGNESRGVSRAGDGIITVHIGDSPVVSAFFCNCDTYK